MKKLFLLLFLINLTACPLIPVFDTFKQMGMTEDSRKELLPKKVKNFYNDLMSQRFLHMGQYLAEERREALLADLRKNRKDEKIIEGKIDLLDFYDNTNRAEVEMIVRYYQSPYFIVKERIEQQTWKFYGSNSGWRLYRRSFKDL